MFDQVDKANEELRKTLESQVDLKLEQIETGFETGFQKLEMEFDAKQRNSISELECKIQVNLLDLETQLSKEIESFNSKIDVLKEEESQFGSLLSSLMLKAGANCYRTFYDYIFYNPTSSRPVIL